MEYRWCIVPHLIILNVKTLNTRHIRKFEFHGYISGWTCTVHVAGLISRRSSWPKFALGILKDKNENEDLGGKKLKRAKEKGRKVYLKNTG